MHFARLKQLGLTTHFNLIRVLITVPCAFYATLFPLFPFYLPPLLRWFRPFDIDEDVMLHPRSTRIVAPIVNSFYSRGRFIAANVSYIIPSTEETCLQEPQNNHCCYNMWISATSLRVRRILRGDKILMM